MNEKEQTVADKILQLCLSNSDKVQNYLTFLKAVKLRLEIAKIIAAKDEQKP